LNQKLGELYTLERLSSGDSPVHRLHPGVKILTTLLFIVLVVSFDRYALGRLAPFLFYPSILIALGDLPPGLLIRRTGAALPFCLFAGISNCIIERNTAFALGNLPLSFGFLSLCTLLLRTFLCVAAVLILIATTPWSRLSTQLRRFHVPLILVTLLEMCYRYIAVLLGEVQSMYTAYKLRSCGMKGIAMAHMGSFVGRLFLRSADRAERVYAAMKCRGYNPAESGLYGKRIFSHEAGNSRLLSAENILFFVLVSLSCVLFRLFDLPALAGSLISRVVPL
jgi:cobalt/nickel transport system permease protein